MGGAAVCCLALELLGGAVVLGGLTTVVGLSTGVTYLLVVGAGAVLAGLLALGYHQIGEVNDASGVVVRNTRMEGMMVGVFDLFGP